MMRLPKFRYVGPKTIEEAAHILQSEGPDAMPLAGGTDLFPNMKRRQQTPKVVVGLRGIESLFRTKVDRSGIQLGPMLSLTDVVDNHGVREAYGALYKSAVQVSTPQLRNMGTLGGNLCLDTRCNYYDQGYEWRKAIDFCMKKDGKICWVAPSSPRCWAVSSTDTAPALITLRAKVTLVSRQGERTIDLDQFYADDGMSYLTRKPGELLANVSIPDSSGWKSTYWKLRRRGSFDFPVLSVAAAVKVSKGIVEEARIVLGSVASRPLWQKEAGEILRGKKLTDDAIAAVSESCFKPSKPMDNTDFELAWRKKMVRFFVSGAFKELRGDDIRDIKNRSMRTELPTHA